MHVRAYPLRRPLTSHLHLFPALAGIGNRAGLSVPGAMLAGTPGACSRSGRGRPAKSRTGRP